MDDWEKRMETFNKYMVGVQDKNIVIVNPPIGPMSKSDALLLAAWLVTLAANDEGTDFDAILRAIQS